MTLKNIIFFLFTVVISVTLINVGYFGSSTLAAYFFYVISAAILIAFTGWAYSKYKDRLPTFNFLPILLFSALTSYYFLRNVFHEGDSFFTIHTYILVNCLLLIGFTILFKIRALNKLSVYKVILALAVIESFICLFQMFGVLQSQNEYLPVSGTWVNPNVTAMFLALALPACIILIIQAKSFYKILYTISLILIVTALLLLRCRTAIVGGLIATGLIITDHYNLAILIKNKLNFVKRIALIVVLLIIATPLCLYLYKAKQASADGRQLIWKLSIGMIAEKPIIGFGYGTFEHDYNLKQAEYFSNNNGSTNEIKNASFVHMAYNEFLQNTVEGGLIGFILFTGFIITLLIPLKFAKEADKSNNSDKLELSAARGAIVAFTIMSIMNFTLEAIPVMALFIIYASVICTSPSNKTNFLPAWIKPSLSTVFIIAGAFIFISQVSLAKAYTKTNNAAQLIKENDNSNAIEILEPLENKMQTSEFYWSEYGKALYSQRKYKEALRKFNQSAKYSFSPSVQMQISNCYFRLKQYDNAINALQFLCNMIPNRLASKYAMMKIYQQTNDTLNSHKIAAQLIEMQPKGTSRNAVYYKQEAQKILTAKL